MASSFIAYVDESGDEGFSFAAGSSEWFVLSALLLRRETELEAVKVLDGVKGLFKKELRRPLHFRKLDHHQRVAYVTELAKHRARMRTISVLVHKPSLKDVERFKGKYLLYRYATRFLLERVLWFCRDHRRAGTGDGTVEVIFSNRRNMSYEEIRAYLDVLRSKPDVKIDWSAIRRDQVDSLPHDQRRGLQIVDAVASSYWYGLNPNVYGQTEDRYARILHPLAYARYGRYAAYGLKFFPGEVEALIRADERFRWVRELRT